MRETEIVGVRRVYQGFFAVDEATVTYEKPDGSWSPPSTRLSVERGDAVAVLIHDPEKDVFLLVRQYRYPTARHGEPWLLEIVAGTIDPGETAEEAARREALEETGIELDSLEQIAQFYGSPGGLSEKLTIFNAEGRYDGGGGGLENEDVEVVEIPTKEAFAMVERGEIHDGKSLVALLWRMKEGASSPK